MLGTEWLEMAMQWLAATCMLVPFGVFWCCCDRCEQIFADEFSVDNLATDWDDRSGTWTVAGGVANCASASGLIVANTAVTGGLTGVFAHVAITCATTSNAGRLIIGYSDDNNHWFLEAQPGMINGTLKLFQRSGGVNTQKGSTKTIVGFQAGVEVSVAFCYSPTMFKAQAQVPGPDPAVVMEATSISIAGTKCGLGTGSASSDVDFDDFQISTHDVDDPTCPFCDLPCNPCEDMVPDELEIELPNNLYDGVDTGGGCWSDSCCSSVEGQTYVLTLRESPVFSGTCFGGGPFDCYYQHTELMCDSPGGACLSLYLIVVAVFSVADGGTLTVSVTYMVAASEAAADAGTGSGLSSLVFKLTGIGSGITCEGEPWDVPYNATDSASCSQFVCTTSSDPDDVVVSV